MYAHPERPNKLSEGSNDAAVRSTDVDALVSRCSASSLGYLDDKLASHFLAPSQRRSLERRPPLINIGTHARTWAVDRLVDQFLQVGPHNQKQQPQRQVLSLGAGTDSRFWRIAQRREQQGRDRAEPHEEVCARWVEVDFPEATAAKARAVSTKPDLRKHLGTDIAIREHGRLENRTSECRSTDVLTRQNAAASVSRRPATPSCRATCATYPPSQRLWSEVSNPPALIRIRLRRRPPRRPLSTLPYRPSSSSNAFSSTSTLKRPKTSCAGSARRSLRQAVASSRTTRSA